MRKSSGACMCVHTCVCVCAQDVHMCMCVCVYVPCHAYVHVCMQVYMHEQLLLIPAEFTQRMLTIQSINNTLT